MNNQIADHNLLVSCSEPTVFGMRANPQDVSCDDANKYSSQRTMSTVPILETQTHDQILIDARI